MNNVVEVKPLTQLPIGFWHTRVPHLLGYLAQPLRKPLGGVLRPAKSKHIQDSHEDHVDLGLGSVGGPMNITISHGKGKVGDIMGCNDRTHILRRSDEWTSKAVVRTHSG